MVKFTFVLEGSWWTNDQCLAQSGKVTSINLISEELTPSVPRSLYANGHVLRTTWGGHSILELRKHNETTSFEPWVQILIPKPPLLLGADLSTKKGRRKQGPWDHGTMGPWVCSECLGNCRPRGAFAQCSFFGPGSWKFADTSGGRTVGLKWWEANDAV